MRREACSQPPSLLWLTFIVAENKNLLSSQHRNG